MQEYDLIIVGGGLVGASLAAALRETGCRIALVDAHLPSLNDPRLFALNESSCQLLKNIGVWSELASHASPIHHVHVSYQGRFGAVNFSHEDVQLPSLGHVVPAKYIEIALQSLLEKTSSVTLYRPATLQTLSQENHRVFVSLLSDQTEIKLSAPILIGADGTHSTVRTLLNMPVETFDYQQSAIVTITHLSRSHEHIAYERFTSQGVIAMLPLPENQCATIGTADNDIIFSLMKLSDEGFLQSLQTAFGYRLGRLKAIGKRHMFPIQRVCVKNMVQENVFLIGNAAHTMSPIAAQSFNLALYEVAVLAEVIQEKIKTRDFLTSEDLKFVNERIQKQQAVSMGLSHRLSKLSLQNSSFSQMAVQLGLISLEMVSPFKKRLLNRMIGRSGRVPHLLLDHKEI